MATISIDYNSENKEVYLCGDIEAIKRNRFAWRYVRDYFSPREEMGRIVIPVMDEEPFPILSSIRSMLSKYGFTEKKTESSEKILLDFYEEERKFDEFSQKALRIRNNECDKVEFEKFTNSIACHLPARSLYPLQLLSAYHMAFSQNACNFSVPGAGKTSIVYGAYAYLHSLPSQGFLCVDRGVTGSRFYVSPEYESLVASQCIRKRKAISLEQLKKRLKSDELAGEKAELFVVKYEKKRLGVEGENKVKRISEIDVTAGYDIVSANSPNSTVANRFIEVKAVSENGFYWSKNEYDIAKLLAADYYLYLVDLSKIDDDNYEPDIIHNPVQHIMENNLWLVEPQSYHIQKVKF